MNNKITAQCSIVSFKQPSDSIHSDISLVWFPHSYRHIHLSPNNSRQRFWIWLHCDKGMHKVWFSRRQQPALTVLLATWPQRSRFIAQWPCIAIIPTHTPSLQYKHLQTGADPKHCSSNWHTKALFTHQPFSTRLCSQMISHFKIVPLRPHQYHSWHLQSPDLHFWQLMYSYLHQR